MNRKISADANSIWGTGQSTNANSSTYEAFASQEADTVTIVNNASVQIAVRKVSSGESPLLLDPTASLTFSISNNVNEIEWRRADGAATSTTISYLYSL